MEQNINLIKAKEKFLEKFKAAREQREALLAKLKTNK